MSQSREFDIILYGATGFTGKLVAEHLTRRQGDEELRWAMAGRSLDKLEDVRASLELDSDFPLVVADATDPDSIKDMVRRTRLVISTVGPYQLYGADLIAACAAMGTDYVDLCGEPAFMRQMIDAHDKTAQKSGARIVFSCGFDSIPFDLGVKALQKGVKARYGKTAPRVKGRVRALKGSYSGGTAASLKASLAAAAADPAIRDLLRNPFSLTPGFKGVAQPDGDTPAYDESLGSWAAPFVMAAINTRNIHRTNALLGHPYGTDFAYDEMLLTGPGDEGKTLAETVASSDPLASADGRKPGEGPDKAERESGFYDLLFIAVLPDDGSLSLSVYGERDPGYGSTSRILAESALCLLKEDKDAKGGILTPGAVFGEALMARVADHAGLHFTLDGTS